MVSFAVWQPYFLFIYFALGVWHKITLLQFMSEIFKSLNHFEFIFLLGFVRVYKGVFEFHWVTNTCSCPTFPTPLLKRLSFLHCIFLSPLLKISWPQVCGFVSGLAILFHWSMSAFLPIAYCFDYCSSVLSEFWGSHTSSFVLFPQDCFGNAAFLWFHINFMITCSSS